MKAYFDGSGDGNSQYLVLAGVAALEFVWSSFEEEWKRILLDRDPPAPYLHMRELVSLQGAFSAEKGWDVAKQSKLIWDCMMYVQHLHKEDFRTFTCTIDMSEYRAKIAAGYPLPSPYHICSRWCPDIIVDWFFREVRVWHGQRLTFYFDQNERHKGVFQERLYRKKSIGKGLRNPYFHIEVGDSGDAKTSLPLQFADLLAWSHNRALTAGKSSEERPWDRLASVCESVLPFTRKEIGPRDLDYYSAFSVLRSHWFEQFR